ncbi:MAG TPA: D-2-hydroxyacid dehydrogenase [Actinomycetota bacterium]|nr:D-2-hydroxyacid dehydrogenase [Actinomycetota bacterium]
MSDREKPVVAVLGATVDDAPPGIEPANELAELRYAEDPERVAAATADADVIFSWGARRSWLEDAFADATRLRWIQAASDGVDSLLFPALIASEVIVTNARGIFDDPIAEWAIAAMMAFTTGLHISVVDQTKGVWTDGRRRDRVTGQHLVVVGPGPIGRAAATRAKALGMTVEAVGRNERTDDVLGPITGPDGFHQALGRADHVLDALPLTEGTRAMFDAKAFDSMRPTAHFVNVGRGATVDEDALIDAVRSGAIAGASLDVFVEEPLPADSPLWSMPTVAVSPHISGDVRDWEEAVVGVFVDNLRRFVAGTPLRNKVDAEAGFGVG